VVVADDLTGACDTALQFRRRGARAVVHFDLRAFQGEQSDVDAFSTESRNLEPCTSAKRISLLARTLRECCGEAPVVFKKIDSLLRGAPGAEIRAAMDAFECDVAVITPAFPELGRKVVEGRLHVEGDASWRAMDVLAVLHSQGLPECQHVSPSSIAKLLANGCRYISADSTSNEELNIVADEAMRCGRKVLWAGSAGLAGSLAEILFSGTDERKERRCGRQPVLFLIGSQHPVTAGQVKNLSNQRRASELDAASNTPRDIANILTEGRHAIVRVPMGEIETDRVRQLLCAVNGLVEAVVISGGDTLSLFSQATTSESIEIEGQIVAGLPFGRIRGGLLEGMTVATKSGAFGQPDALTKVTDFFTCLSN
jgi:uncharacterized protein YgbK (DUF1537 family)